MGDKNVRDGTEHWFTTDELTTCPSCGRPRRITTARGVTYCFGCELLTSPDLPSALPAGLVVPLEAPLPQHTR